MATILLLVRDRQKSALIQADLATSGHTCLSAFLPESLERLLSRKPDAALIDGEDFPADSEVWNWLLPEQGGKVLPIIILAADSSLHAWDTNLNVDDFLLIPHRKPELLSRIRRLLKKSDKLDIGTTIQQGDLTIDDAGYEVKVAGRRIDLTYREYQLLKYLATNSARVVTRETLLNKVWGYDYFGGDRTVDVHIRRLRSKLEDTEHVFIETVRNVGYRFKGQGNASDQEIPFENGAETL